ncbi:unnamed protein product [Didymodactylos carnosus]|uniref:PiggyBac transposable element-derived protein domain-containing protein n=1 Tax=Didymodactylos carnosus TaxID=1234261 RepID=A0A815E1B4_9BILA|nr:unnamed protein product [Didymodactylos carnosus]CAF4139453.1 unnamed protein product [Didymodactylos carnosus]
MRGVDKADMLCALHPIPFRSKKWYIRIAWRLFDRMVINSWLLANHLGKQNVNWKNSRLCDFKTEIACTLLKGSVALQRPALVPIQRRQHSGSDTDENNRSKSDRKKRDLTRTIPRILRYDGNEHWPKFVKSRLRCKYEECELKTQWTCSKCELHLCIQPQHNCFVAFHTKQ